MRHQVGLLVILAILLGCTAAPQGSVPVAPSTSPTPPAATTGSPTVAALPSESPTPSPTTAQPLDVDWSADDPSGLDPVVSIVGVVRIGETYVLVAELPTAEEYSFAAWRSADGRNWDRVHQFTAGHRILAVTVGGPGIVAGGFDDGGGVIWTSVDGQGWSQVQDPSLRNGVIARLVPTASGLIGFGWVSQTDTGAIWTSEDGLEWLAATNETGRAVARGLQAVESYDGRAVAFVSDPTEGPPAVWETTGRAEWTRVGSLVDDTAQVAVVAGGVRGWVALGSATESFNVAWTSTDGRTWSDAVSGPDVAGDVIADDAGFVAVGFVGSLPGETCGDQRPFAGHTWASADGRMWRQMPVTDEFKGAFVQHLLAVDRTLMGFGQRLPDGGGPSDALAVGRWTAALPAGSRPGSGTEPSEPESCGG